MRPSPRASLHSPPTRVFVLLVASAGLAVAPLAAVDGVVEINQARALAGGITPGDGAGFPVTLSAPGSYRLTSNLDVTGDTSPQNVTAIAVTGAGVTIDLNGFALVGPAVCTRTSTTSCTNAGSGRGVDSVASGTVVRNGQVAGFGNAGLFLASRAHRVEAVVARANAGAGIVVNAGSVRGCTAELNDLTGISVTAGDVGDNHVLGNGGTGIGLTDGVAHDNYVGDNDSIGINASTALVRGNVVSSNGSWGLFVQSFRYTGYAENVFDNNNGAGAEVGTASGAVAAQLGDNLCNNILCP